MKDTTLTLLSSLAATSLLWLCSHTLTDDIFWHTDSALGLPRTTRFQTSGGGFWFETRTWDSAVQASHRVEPVPRQTP